MLGCLCHVYTALRLKTGFDNHQTMTLDALAIACAHDMAAKLKQSLHHSCTVKAELAASNQRHADAS